MLSKIAFAAALGAAVILPSASFADEAGEIATATSHAGYAAKAADINMVHMHLHHVVNCLVGPGGAGFDATNANPCAKAGAGAIPDATDAGNKAKLQAAVTTARSGIAATDLAAAQKAATDTGDQLSAIK